MPVEELGEITIELPVLETRAVELAGSYLDGYESLDPGMLRLTGVRSLPDGLFYRDENGEGDGDFQKAETADADPSWIAYMVAVKRPRK